MNAPISSPRAEAASSEVSSTKQQSPTAVQPAQTCPTPLRLQGMASSTDSFLKDANLIAEAVKRAQVAVMTTISELGMAQSCTLVIKFCFFSSCTWSGLKLANLIHSHGPTEEVASRNTSFIAHEYESE
ncbi:hypothetical protein E4U26_001075 [Claviceps purpurea]|nr:hypothetical protein E4U26_001075 [Claviceps purpurea]